MTYVDIISGFLGAGKTTFIKRLLRDTNDIKTVLIENEFGEIGIDGGFLKDAGIEITEMNSGCICCSLVGDFKEALSKVVRELHPDRIIIEPSGVGKLSDVTAAVMGADEGLFTLRSRTTVVDAGKAKMYMKNFGEFFSDQIANADCVVLSHTENASEEKIGYAENLIRENNDRAEIISTPYDKLSIDVLLAAMKGKDDIMAELEHEYEHHHHHHDEDEECECHHHHHHDEDEECECHHHHHHDEDEHEHEHHHEHDEHCTCGCHDHEHHHHHGHDADEVFTSIGGETNKTYTEDDIKRFLSELDSGKYGQILRAKGYLAADGCFIHFDYVPGEPDVRLGTVMPTGRFCVIGSELAENEIKALLGL